MLQDARGHDPLTVEDRFFLQIALKNRLLSEAEAEEAVARLEREGGPIEAVLFRLRLLDEAAIRRVRQAISASQVVRLDSLYADLALAEGHVTRAQVEEAFAEQRRQRFRVRIGNVLLGRGRVDPEAHRRLISRVIRQVKREAASESGPRPRPTPPTGVPRVPAPPAPPPVPAPAPSPPDEEEGFGHRTVELDVSPVAAIGGSGSEDTTEAYRPTMDLDEGPPAGRGEVEQSLASDARPTSAVSEEGGFIFENLDRLERSGEGAPAPAASTSDSDVSFDDDVLVASAIRLGLSATDETLCRSDERVLRDDLARASASGSDDFVLDRVALSGSKDGSFDPEAYVARRRRRALAFKVSGGALFAAGLVLLIGLGIVAYGNRTRRDEVRELLRAAELEEDPDERQVQLALASKALAEVGPLGVDGAVIAALDERIRWRKLQAMAEASLAAGRPEAARDLLEGKDRDLPELAREEHERLMTEARRLELVDRGAAAVAEERWDAAVLAYREALELGDPGGLVGRRLAGIRSELERRLDAAFEEALASLSPADEAAFAALAKRIHELFHEDPGTDARLRELAFRRERARGIELFRRDSLPGAERAFEEALRLRPDDRDVAGWLERTRRRRELLAAEALGRDAERVNDFAEARARYRSALELAVQDRDRARIEAALERVAAREAALTRAARLERLVERAFAELTASRAAAAAELLEEVCAADPEAAIPRRLLELARAVEGMVYVPAGEFTMGSDPAPGVDPLETPARPVDVPGYFIDRTEVTNAAYARFVAATGRERPRHWTHREVRDGEVVTSYPPDAAEHPVVYVTWEDAAAFAEWRGGRLPTEAEWEKAARGPDGRTFPWGEETGVQAHVAARPRGLRRRATAPVGASADDVSPYGARDMAGNVNEWTADELAPYPGARGAEAPDEARMVIRGGAYRYGWEDARCSAREGARPGYAAKEVGFRVAVPIPGELAGLFR